MPVNQTAAESAYDQAKEQIPSCAATPEELVQQRERQARLAPGVLDIERAESAVVISFAGDFDRAALDEMIEVERRCCPFFLFDLDESELRLTMTVREPDQRPALEAIASALQASIANLDVRGLSRPLR